MNQGEFPVWVGNIVWEFVDHSQHHDFRRLPNGNTLYIGWEPMPDDRARRVRGGVPGTENGKGGKIYSDYLREVTPAGRVVWDWHAYHLEIEKYPLADDCWRWEFAHMNSCCPLPDGRVLLSFRHLDTIMMIDRAGDLVWEYVCPFFSHVFPGDGPCNALFRAYRYAADSPEIGGRLPRPS